MIDEIVKVLTAQKAAETRKFRKDGKKEIKADIEDEDDEEGDEDEEDEDEDDYAEENNSDDQMEEEKKG